MSGGQGWARDLALGARFAVTGGREGWIRAVLTALGVGLGVTLLLGAASVPSLLRHHHERSAARDVTYYGEPLKASDKSLVIAAADTTFRDDDITGWLLRPDGSHPPVPPGLQALPRPGEMVVSPALKDLLAEPGSALLRQRLPYRTTGTIGDQGLIGPTELLYYAGSDTLKMDGHAYRIDTIGGSVGSSGSLDAVLTVLMVIVLVVLLMPVAVFVATAVRFGGERRDRRLAALRLVGADSRSTRRIAAGEALFGSLLGLAAGVELFFLVRPLAQYVSLEGTSFFPSEVTPSIALALLICLAVPASAVLVTQLAMRGVVVEPLGVVRRSRQRPRRLWWRLLIPAAGLALLAPMFGQVRQDSGINTYQVAGGACLLLIGVTTLLPWLVEAAVSRFRGGPLPWQLATRRIQLDSSSSARMVSGVTIAVSGAIALQMLFSGVQADYTTSTGKDSSRAQLVIDADVRDAAQAQSYTQAFRTTQGVRSALGYVNDTYAVPPGLTRKALQEGNYPQVPVAVGDCATLGELATLDHCANGDVFLVDQPEGYGDVGQGGDPGKFAKPGSTVDFNVPDGDTVKGSPRLWTVPAGARTAESRPSPNGDREWGIFATPAALDARLLHEPAARILIRTDPADADAVEQVRNTAARIDPLLHVEVLLDTKQDKKFTDIRRGLLIGSTAVLALIGASLLVTMLEQLRERKRLLAVLVAYGTRRTTLGLSVLWQTAIPVVLGLALSVLSGLGLGAALLQLVRAPVRIDWASAAGMTGVGAAVVLGVTLLSLPPLWRMMRPDGLRTE